MGFTPAFTSSGRQDLHALVHGPRSDENLGNVDLVRLEPLADLLHAVQESLVQDFPGALLCRKK